MRCEKCSPGKISSAAVFENPPLCRDHFIKFFEEKVSNTINKNFLLEKKERIVVAASGGKDSTAVLYILKKLGFNVEALAIDEGIKGYRNKTLRSLRSFCKKNGIMLRVVSYEIEFSMPLDSIIGKIKVIPCSVCGALRRNLLNKYSKGYSKIATGHNLDDEVQSIIMNFMKGNSHLNARLGPLSGIAENKGFVPRIKPLLECSEKEVLAYSVLMGLGPDFAECPHVSLSFRSRIRDALNHYEEYHPGAKSSILRNFGSVRPVLKKHFLAGRAEERGNGIAEKAALNLEKCRSCGQPSSRGLCKACEFKTKFLGKHSSKGKAPKARGRH